MTSPPFTPKTAGKEKETKTEELAFRDFMKAFSFSKYGKVYIGIVNPENGATDLLRYEGVEIWFRKTLSKYIREAEKQAVSRSNMPNPTFLKWLWYHQILARTSRNREGLPWKIYKKSLNPRQDSENITQSPL